MYPTLGLLGLCALACTSCHPATTASTTTTSAQHYAAGSPDARIVDNAGFVDPGGRTRSVTTHGAVVTSPANAVSPTRREDPIAPTADASNSAPIGPPTAAPNSPSDPVELTQRAARALCDREAYCDRVGDDKTYKSSDACFAEKRDRVGRLVSESRCREIRGERVAACLTAIRGAECGPTSAPLAPPAECTAHALCAR